MAAQPLEYRGIVEEVGERHGGGDALDGMEGEVADATPFRIEGRLRNGCYVKRERKGN